MGKLGQQFEHLTDAQIEHYGETKAGAGPEADQSIESHLAECPGCRARVLAFHRGQFAPATPESAVPESMTDSSFSTARRPDCPNEDVLRSLAAGLTPPGQAVQFIQHAAECAHCGRTLSMYTEDFSDDLTPEDEALLGQLKSSSPEWRKRLLETIGICAKPGQDYKP